MNQSLKNGIGLVWLFLVVFSYLKYHSYYGESLLNWKVNLGHLIIWGAILAITWLYLNKNKVKTVTITPIRVLIFALVSILITSSILFFGIKPAIYQGEDPIVKWSDYQYGMIDAGDELEEGMEIVFEEGTILPNAQEVLSYFPEEVGREFEYANGLTFQINILGKVLMIGFILVLFTTLFYGVGKWALHRFEHHDTVENGFIAIGLGIGVTMMILFLIAAAGQFTTNIVGAVMGLLFIGALFKVKPLLKAFWNSKVKVNWQEVGWIIIPLLAITIIGSFYVLNIMRPQPMGWDAAYAYLNIPKLMAESGDIVPLNYLSAMPGYLMITSLGFVLFKSTMVALALNFLGGVLAFAFLFYIIKEWVGWQRSATITALFMGLPMVGALMMHDLKIEMALLLMSLLAVFCALQWWKHRSKKKEKFYLVMTGVFLGIALSIKLSSVMLIAAVLAAVAFSVWSWAGAGLVFALSLRVLEYTHSFTLWHIWESNEMVANSVKIGGGLVAAILVLYLSAKRQLNWERLRPTTILIGLIVLIMSPFLIRNVVATSSVSFGALINGEHESISVDYDAFGIDRSACQSALDYPVDTYRYTGFNKGLKLLWTIPWETTSGVNNPNSYMQDASFIFLGFLILLILHGKSIDDKKIPIKFIGVAGVVYWILWLFVARGIAWYGLPGLIFFFLLYDRLWNSYKWMLFIPIFYLIPLISLQLSTLNNSYYPFLYAGGVMSAQEYKEQIFLAGADEVEALVNSEEVLDKKILVTANMMPYFIAGNNTRVLQDNLLETFNCLYTEKDGVLTLERLRELGFGFLIVHFNQEVTPAERLYEYQENFKTFAENYLIIRVENPYVSVYEVPRLEAEPEGAILDPISQ